MMVLLLYSSKSYTWIILSVFILFHLHFSETNHFFHITDFHLDVNYSQFGDVTHWCHAFQNGSKGTDIGIYGNYTCDAPLTLIQSAVMGMKQMLPNPDFIIWTGDSFPHVPNSTFDMNGVIKTLHTVTDAIS